MRKLTWAAAALLLVIPAVSHAAEYSAYGTTLLQFQKWKTPGVSETLVPLTQFLGVDADGLANGNLSLHFYGWGRVDLADPSFNDDDADGNFTYGYLRYRFPTANGEITAGRFFQTTGGIVQQLDGLAVRADLAPLASGLSLALFLGSPVKPAGPANNSGDFLAGGRLGYRLPNLLDLGVIYQFNSGADSREASYNSATKTYTTRTVAGSNGLVGGDLWLKPHRMLEIFGRTLYDTSTGGFAENSYRLVLRPMAPLSVTAEFNQNELANYFAATSLPNLFRPYTGNTVTSYGVNGSYQFSKDLELALDYRYTGQDTRNGSNRIGGELRVAFLDGLLRTGLGYHWVDGGTVKAGYVDNFVITSYNELRGYGLYAKNRFEASIDCIADFYERDIYGTSTAFVLQASAGYTFLPELKLSADLSYGSTPQMDDEFMALLRLTFAYTTTSKGAGK